MVRTRAAIARYHREREDHANPYISRETHHGLHRATMGNSPTLPSEGKGHTFESCRVRQRISLKTKTYSGPDGCPGSATRGGSAHGPHGKEF